MKIAVGKWWLAALVTAMAVVPAVARPCGLCREDDRSAVYSYQAIQKVKANPELLEFAVFKVLGPLPPETVPRLTQWLQARPGVDSETVKISTSQHSMGFVWKKSGSKDTLIADLRRDFPELQVHVRHYEATSLGK